MDQSKKPDIIETDLTAVAKDYLEELLGKVKRGEVEVKSLKSGEVAGDRTAEMIVIAIKK